MSSDPNGRDNYLRLSVSANSIEILLKQKLANYKQI